MNIFRYCCTGIILRVRNVGMVAAMALVSRGPCCLLLVSSLITSVFSVCVCRYHEYIVFVVVGWVPTALCSGWDIWYACMVYAGGCCVNRSFSFLFFLRAVTTFLVCRILLLLSLAFWFVPPPLRLFYLFFLLVLCVRSHIFSSCIICDRVYYSSTPVYFTLVKYSVALG